jgi:selenocysteine lyase/cysteine desulfurase
MYGPQGTGFLYIAEDIVLKPLIVGGTGGRSTELTQPDDIPERYESGTHNIAAIAGLKAAADFIASRGIDSIMQHEMSLVRRLVEGLTAVNGIKVFNTDLTKSRGSVVSFTLNGVDPSTIGFILDRDFDIAVREVPTAPSCPSYHRHFPEGTVRVLRIFNTKEDIDRFLAQNEIAGAKMKGAGHKIGICFVYTK